MPRARIEARDISVRFGAVTAVAGVSLAARPGEVLAIVGENGAGKSTLMNVLFGLVRPTSGAVYVDGTRVVFAGAGDAIRAGIGMVHQHFHLVQTLTVAENVVLGDEPARGVRFDVDAACARVEKLAASLGFALDPRAIVEELSVGAQQRVEIVKSLARGARTLILDEPTAVLTPQEADDLFRVVRNVAAAGTAVLFISHKLGEVKTIANRIAVMRAGALVTTIDAPSATTKEIAQLMVGHELKDALPRATAPMGAPVLTFDDVSVERALTHVSLAVRAGEIVGVAGVEGNGQAELVAAAVGLVKASGRVTLLGADVSGEGPRERAARGLAHVPGDRLRDGVAAALTVEENLVLGRHREEAFRTRLGVDRAALHAHAVRCEDELDVRPRDPRLPLRALSGGNQQKAVIARELSRAPKVLVAAHPTRGVDVGAVEAIHTRLLAERDRGAGILLVSADLAEILALSDRVVVLYGGRVVHETAVKDTDERKLGAHMLGAT